MVVEPTDLTAGNPPRFAVRKAFSAGIKPAKCLQPGLERCSKASADLHRRCCLHWRHACRRTIGLHRFLSFRACKSQPKNEKQSLPYARLQETELGSSKGQDGKNSNSTHLDVHAFAHVNGGRHLGALDSQRPVSGSGVRGLWQIDYQNNQIQAYININCYINDNCVLCSVCLQKQDIRKST